MRHTMSEQITPDRIKDHVGREPVYWCEILSIGAQIEVIFPGIEDTK